MKDQRTSVTILSWRYSSDNRATKDTLLRLHVNTPSASGRWKLASCGTINTPGRSLHPSSQLQLSDVGLHLPTQPFADEYPHRRRYRRSLIRHSRNRCCNTEDFRQADIKCQSFARVVLLYDSF